MKKTLTSLLSLALIAALAGCGGTHNDATPQSPSFESDSESSDPNRTVTTDSAALVAYFSRTGNTTTVADLIAARTGADTFRIEPATPYADDYDTMLDVARQENRDDARPTIAGTVDGIDDYDVVYLGTPLWWAQEPMIIRTFLDDYDLSGKIVAPFCTSGGSSCAQFVESLKKREPDATVLEPLQVDGDAAADAAGDVDAWLTGNGLA